MSDWLIGVGLLLIALFALWHLKGAAWWTRVSNTEGGKRALEDIGDIEEWIRKTRVGIEAHKASSPVVAAPIAAADPPAAETSPPTGPAAPSIAESAAPSAIGGTPMRLPDLALSPSFYGREIHVLPTLFRVSPIPAAPAAQQEKSMIAQDKGIITAGQLLSGWVLANWETQTAPVPAKRHADLMYLAQMNARGANLVYEDVIIGTQQEVNVCKNYPHTNGWDPQINYNYDGTYADWSKDADPAIKAAAEASLAAYLVAHPRTVNAYDFARHRRG